MTVEEVLARWVEKHERRAKGSVQNVSLWSTTTRDYCICDYDCSCSTFTIEVTYTVKGKAGRYTFELNDANYLVKGIVDAMNGETQ